MDTTTVHLSIGGWRIKTVPSRLTEVDLASTKPPWRTDDVRLPPGQGLAELDVRDDRPSDHVAPMII
jgi:hypothetical protein